MTYFRFTPASAAVFHGPQVDPLHHLPFGTCGLRMNQRETCQSYGARARAEVIDRVVDANQMRCEFISQVELIGLSPATVRHVKNAREHEKTIAEKTPEERSRLMTT